MEYNLPYPGILPDSPLYIFKVARDNLFELILLDPKQKAFYLLLMADKRLSAGFILINNGKTDLGVTTITQGQQDYTRAVDLAVKNKDANLLSKLAVAGAKHEEVIALLQPKVADNKSAELQKALEADQNDKNRVLELLMTK